MTTASGFASRRFIGPITAVGVGLVLLCATGCRADTFDALGPDRTVDDLVLGHDLIVVGVVSSYLGSNAYPGHDELATELPPDMPTEMWEDFQDDYSRFEVSVEEVLLDRHGALAPSGPGLVIEDPWGPPYPEGSTSMDGHIRVGDRYLMILSKARDADTYVMWNMVADRIVIDADAPVDSKGAPVPSAGGMTTAEFMQAVRDAIARQYAGPTR